MYGKQTVIASADLFSVPPVQRSIEYGHFSEIRPISSIDSSIDSPIEFLIPCKYF